MHSILLIRKTLGKHRVAFALLFLTSITSGVYAQSIGSVGTDEIIVTATVGERIPAPPDNLEEWVTYYFGNDNNFSAESDFDGDGHLDYLEFYAGTDPTDGASKLKITETTLSGNDVIIKWSPTPNGEDFIRKYRIFRGGPDALGALTDPQATIQSLRGNENITELTDTEIDSGGFSTSYTDVGARDNFPLFYKVILSDPEPQVP